MSIVDLHPLAQFFAARPAIEAGVPGSGEALACALRFRADQLRAAVGHLPAATRRDHSVVVIADQLAELAADLVVSGEWDELTPRAAAICEAYLRREGLT